MIDELPQGWALAKLNDVVSLALGGDWGKDADKLGNGLTKVRVIRGTEFKRWRDEKGATAAERCLKVSSLEKRRLQKGDLVLEVSGGGPNQPVGRTVLIDDEALKQAGRPLVCSNFFRLLRLHSEVDCNFINHFLNHSYGRGVFNEFQTETTNLRNLNVPDFLEKTDIALAPLNEQRRIVAKLEKLLGKIDACQKRLAKIPFLFKRFRQSVLAAACSGRLTADWREDHLELPEPDDWESATLAELAVSLHQGINTAADRVAYVADGFKILQSKHITSGTIDDADARFVSVDDFAKYKSRYNPRKGHVLFTNIGTIGRSLVVPDDREFLIAWNIFKIEFGPRVLPAFARSFLEMLRGSGYYDELNRGNATQFVNKKQLSQIVFPVPPLAEQQEIVHRVGGLFALADQIEARYAKAKAHVEKLTQSILAKAFRGELVPQDPNDEPASVLVERIKQQRAENTNDQSVLKRSQRHFRRAKSLR